MNVEPSKGNARRIREGRTWQYGRWITDRCNPIPITYSGTQEQKMAVATTSNLLRRLVESARGPQS